MRKLGLKIVLLLVTIGYTISKWIGMYSKKRKEMKISKHLSLKEVTKSNTAIKNGIENVPDDVQLQNLIILAENVFEPLREHVNGPIFVGSLVSFGGAKP